MSGTKIATCCYCGHRAALELRGSVRHELACAQCGAPLHDLKAVPARKVGAKRAPSPVKPPPHRLKRDPEKRYDREEKYREDSDKKRRKSKKKKRKKGLTERFFDEAFDIIEDIFD